ncbi:MAG: Ig domain-containing protein [Balneolaceae bacterium]
MNFTHKLILTFIGLLFCGITTQAQNKLVQNYSQLMEIPEVITMQASSSHLYLLSDEEGMAVFRTYPDSLQWLYTSTGMQRRGDKIMADVRFAYLFGDSRRLTVLEPTSVLGVYSATVLPVEPRAAARINDNLYIALGNEGLGFVSLESPESVDSTVQFAAKNEIGRASVVDIKSSDLSKQLFVLTDNPSVLVFNSVDDNLELSSRISLRNPLEKIFLDNEKVWGSTASGDIFEINTSGIGKKIGSIEEPVSEVIFWKNQLLARSESGEVWVSDNSGNLRQWKKDGTAGNFITNSGERLWISENNKVAEVFLGTPENINTSQASGAFKINDIPNQILTYPNPLLLSLEIEGNYPADEVEFSYRSGIKSAKIRKQGFVWQPNVNQIGTHWFNIIATNSDGKTDSTRFTADVRSFNSPPRFSPMRTSSIAVNEPYTIQFKATDPEDPSSQLIRYIGVDLPRGANIKEHTGVFTWTPSERQIGESTFKVIATDKMGAASSIDVTIKVLDISRDSQ